MDVYHVGEFTECGVFAHQDRDLLDDVGSVGTVGVTTENLISGGNKKFQHALCGIHGESLAVGTPEGFLARIGNTLCFELILCGAYTGGFGFGENGCGHDVETDVVLLAEDMVDGSDSLHFCRMGEHLLAIHIADGIEVSGEWREVRDYLIVFIDGDGAVGGESDACGFEV